MQILSHSIRIILHGAVESILGPLEAIFQIYPRTDHQEIACHTMGPRTRRGC
jgi:hypothetical protein